MKLRLLLPATLLLLLSACKHKDPKPEVIYVDAATKQHFSFKPGSYWIFKDSISGRIDSCYVVRLDSFMLNYSNNSKIGQTISVNTSQYPVTPLSSDSIKMFINMRSNNIQIDYPNDSEPLVFFLMYPFTVGKTFSPNPGRITNILDKFSLSHNEYSNVAECYQSIGDNPSNYAWLYLNDSIGIIKLSISTAGMHRIWELQRCHIIK